MKFSGIDLHSNNSVVLISDEADRIVYQKRLPNDLAQILGALEPRIMKVAVPPLKHSPMFGQEASSHTVCS